MKKIIVTGSSGLIGSEVSTFFLNEGWNVFGIDNNERAVFFGKAGDTQWNRKNLLKFKNYQHLEIDIRNRNKILETFQEIRPEAIVHTAAQPSHDLAANIPFDDFDTNATGTLNLLEATRQFCADAPFIHMSTNKVYGDAPNELLMLEHELRYDYQLESDYNGINETCRIDQSKHSLFGASKVAADIMVQEYGRYFNLPTCCLRGGCLTGPNHSGVELHGFLSYLIKCNLTNTQYQIYGYKGKQVRDNIHSQDVSNFIDLYIKSPKIAQVYNIGGGRKNSISILEAFQKIEQISNKKMIYKYNDKNREGDHICYISDLSKMKNHFPNWNISINIDQIFEDIYNSWIKRLK